MNLLTKIQIDHNKSSDDRWALFANHRKQVTERLCEESASSSGRLCVLGAGNCNDLALGTLLRSYREVHLVDLDGDALTRGVARQSFTDSPTVYRHGGLDVTGMLDVLAGWSPQTALPTLDGAAWVEKPTRCLGPVLPGPFEVVASTCLLSQLIAAVVHSIGERHPRFVELIQAIRAGHLRLLAHLLAPGGVGVLITDVVSSDSCPALGSIAPEALPAVLAQLIRARNFFHGVNPAVLASVFRTDPVLNSQVVELNPVPPWRWNLGPRCYAVCALKVRRTGT